jgi:hypothetical protein
MNIVGAFGSLGGDHHAAAVLCLVEQCAASLNVREIWVRNSLEEVQEKLKIEWAN